MTAFRAATRLVAVIDELLVALPAHPAFPHHPRLNVGDLALPGHPGTVPGMCRMRCDIRVAPGTDRDALHALYRSAADQVSAELGVAVSAEPYQGGGCRSHEIAAENPLALCRNPELFGRLVGREVPTGWRSRAEAERVVGLRRDRAATYYRTRGQHG